MQSIQFDYLPSNISVQLIAFSAFLGEYNAMQQAVFPPYFMAYRFYSVIAFDAYIAPIYVS
jgi:hypothetical protein